MRQVVGWGMRNTVRRRGVAASDLVTALVLLLITVGTAVGAFAFYAGNKAKPEGEGSTALGELPPPSVSAAVVREQQVAAEIRARGQFTPRREISLTSEVTARVVARPKEVGQQVAMNDVLLELDATQLQIQLDEAKANEARALARLTDANEQLARARGSGNQRNIVDATNQQASAAAAHELAQVQRRQAEANFERRFIRAPIDGVLAQLAPNVGEFVAEKQAVGQVLELKELLVEFPLTAREVSQIDDKTTFTLFPETNPEAGLPAKLVAIAPQADLKTRTFAVQLSVENPEGRWRPGVFCEVRCTTEPRNMLVVPWIALRSQAGGERRENGGPPH